MKKSLSRKLLLALFFVLVLLMVVAAVGLKYVSDNYGVQIKTWFNPPGESRFTLQKYYPTQSVSLEPVSSGFSYVTDIAFVPGSDSEMFVLQKSGEIILADTDPETEHVTIASLDVRDHSEQGLLGIAFHPGYPQTACIYLNYVPASPRGDIWFSRVAEWCSDAGIRGNWKENRILFELPQPWSNHNAGALVFDKEGNLLIPWGDGGSGHDPQGNGQNIKTYLGTVMRIRPTAQSSEKPYEIPAGNPFVGDPEVADEIYAWGFRNPWRASLDPRGRLVVADVGQNRWEEIDIVVPGGNYGWKTLEGSHCLEDPCDGAGTILPVFEYAHSPEKGVHQGYSITGGHVYTATDFPELENKYLFGDYVTGQLWAAELPDQYDGKAKVWTLGQWPVFPATFARDASGRVYVAGYVRGEVYRIVPPSK